MSQALQRQGKTLEGEQEGLSCLSPGWTGTKDPLTSTVPLVGPVSTVILPVTFPPVGDAVAIVTVELEVAGAVGGFRGVF